MGEESVELRRLRAHVKRLERDLRRAEERDLSLQEVRESIFELASAPRRAPRWTMRPPPAGDTPGTPILLLSDWHAGEVVRAAEVGGVNTFSMKTLRERVSRVLGGAIVLATKYTTNPQYNGIVVPILGDMVTGEIHDELARTNDRDLLPAVLEVADMLTAVLRTLADTFGRVYAPCVSGNHGRLGKRLEAKSFTVRNFDWLIYNLVERALFDDTRIVIHNPAANEVHFGVHGVRLLALHGHDLGVKGGDGIIGALGPIMRGRLKVGAQQASMGRDFDLLVMGHWHQYLVLPGVVVNNTLKGYDDYAAKFLRAKPSRPSQALFYIHPKQGVTSHWQVFGDKPPRRVQRPHCFTD